MTAAHLVDLDDLPEFVIGTYDRPSSRQNEGEEGGNGGAGDGATPDPAVPAKPFECPVGKGGLFCADDCRTRALCTGVAMPMLNQTCASVNPKQPYCVNNACTATADLADPKCAVAFVCTASGTFPDPADCTIYHTCPAAGGVAMLARCPERYVFDARTLQCRRSDLARQCVRVDCRRTSNDVVVFRPRPAYYAYCVGGLQSQTIMMRCPDVDNEVFNVESGRCEYQCKRRGYFADRSDCNAYHVCEQRQGRLRATRVVCPADNYYVDGACVAETTKCVPELV